MSWEKIIRKKQLYSFAGVLPVCCFSFFFLLVGSTVVGAADTRHHGAHVHGIGQLNIALDGNELIVELRSPAANIVGFEHAPETEQQTHAVHEAIELLEAGGKMFALTQSAQCSLHDAHVESDMAEDHHEEHDAHHEEHGEGHSEHEHDDGAVHSEFVANYHFECVKPEKLETIDVQLFSHFPGFEEIEVQLFTRKLQTAVELTPKNTQILFE